LTKASVENRKGLASAGSVLGIDVGCSPRRRSSAVCRLDWDRQKIHWAIARFRAAEPERSATISRIVGKTPLACVAFDGPLRSDLEPIGVYRVAERLLTRRLQRLIGKPGQSSTPVGKQLNRHANECAKVVLRLGEVFPAAHRAAIHAKAIVEAFPSSFLGLMIAEPQLLDTQRGNRSDIFYAHLARTGVLTRLISDLLPDRRLVDVFEAVTNHDDRAAVVCALTSLCVAARRYSSVGDQQGWIILPPRDFIQPWAWWLLIENAETAREFIFEDTQRPR
jgi:predicted RNase H-like nuclease